jgi:hypothetical protein
MLRWSR